MIDAAGLLADTRSLVRQLVDDLRAQATTDPDTHAAVEREYTSARDAGRTALSRNDWAEGWFAQVAVAWTLGCVFVRFCEDNGLVAEPRLSGPGTRRAIALDHRTAFLSAHPACDDRDWLRAVFTIYRDLPGTGEVFGPHNPVWLLAPSADGARALLQGVQRVDPDTGLIAHDFTDPAWDTRFLGDLYQDLSEHAKKQFALLQTPVFVEEFILDRTLTPALATFGLAATTLIDPTCGSGHFLLGAFRRLFDAWCDADPSTAPAMLAQRALDQLGGVDLNPFAVAIARFRLLLAALRAAGVTTLDDAPDFHVHVAVGDSLLHSDPPGRMLLEGDEALAAAHGYSSEDVADARALLSREWIAVVGNPPYITVKDPALNQLYRHRYDTCHRQYSLGVPFTERFFQLARHDDADPSRAGFVGMITANSFMKREFGKLLIESWVPTHDLTHVLDTSGAFIPGHGTPTVLLFGRNRAPQLPIVRTVMAIRGEPSKPADPEKGHVWSSVVALVDEPGAQNDYVSVVDLDRARLSSHPWSLGGGGAAELKDRLDGCAAVALRGRIEPPIGRAVRIGTEEAFEVAPDQVRRSSAPAADFRSYLTGDVVRDWAAQPDRLVWYPYQEWSGAFLTERWPWRTVLRARRTFQGVMADAGLEWWDYMQHTPSAYATDLSISFANVATNGHFVLTRGGIVFNAHAPVIKLPGRANVRAHLELMAALNSSVATFWLRVTMHDKGNRGEGGGITDEAWERFFEFDGTKLQAFPLPAYVDASTAELLDRLAQELSAVTPGSGVPTKARLGEARARYHQLRAEMVGVQERLDWESYASYGLTDAPFTTGGEPEPSLALGERAFEIVLARKVRDGDEETSWFTRHGSTPITDVPSHWPDTYQRLVERRMALIESDLNVGLIERPEHKRRWAAKPWDDQVKAAARGWLGDRLESERYWPQPAALTTTARLASTARTDPEFVEVAQVYAGRDDVDVAAVVHDLVKSEAVAYLARLRYTASGLRKHAQWQATWDLQRREDAGEDVGEIAVPPKYVKGDFTANGWEHRGKLDVPKERFVSYPGAERESDPSLVVGWAGWDHLTRARALATWYLQSKREGASAESLTAMLDGLDELLPWLLQWYDDPSPDPALDRPGTQIAALITTERRSLG